jgi:glycosyltransferase involved in cell wall biosynthesis
MSREEFEVIWVDDGSTDGSGRTLDQLAHQVSNFSVIHIPNSGWPGRPRNLGIEAAKGRYVLFVDHDDWLEDDALAYLWDLAERNDADVVAAREVGHGFTVPRRMFRYHVPDARLGRDDVLALMTPHKLFRRSMLLEHDIRFPEGPRRLEDHHFVIQAYFHARRITVTGDHPFYHWARREKGGNATGMPFARKLYYENLCEILDIVDGHTEPGALRDRLYAHWLRYKMVHKLLLRPPFRAAGPDAKRLYAEVRRLMLERFPPEVDRYLPVGYRLVARAARADRPDVVTAVATLANGLTLDVALRRVEASPESIAVELEYEFRGPDGSRLRLAADEDGRLSWHPPAELLEGLDIAPGDLDVTDEMASTELALVLRQRGTDLEHDVVIPLPVRSVDDGAELAGTACFTVDPATFASGGPLPDGTWDVIVHAEFGGFRAHRRLGAREAAVAVGGGVEPKVTPTGTLAFEADRGVPALRPLRRVGDGSNPAVGLRRVARRVLPGPARRYT